jgi:hypothetical protein
MRKTNVAFGTRCFPAVVLILLMSVSQSSAGVSISAVGTPILGNSWLFQFQVFGGPVDLMAVQFVSGPGGPFEAPVFSDFTDPGWTDQPTVEIGPNRDLGIAAGPPIDPSAGMYFKISFVGDSTDSLSFNFFAYDDSDVPFSTQLIWNGGPDFSQSDVMTDIPSRDDVLNLIVPAGAEGVPEPSSIIAWSLLGLTMSGTGWWRRRKVSA